MTADDLIFDVGANDGTDTAHYLERGYRVVAVEANPVLADRLKERFFGRPVNVVGRGIAPQRGTATFWVNEANDEHSAFDRSVGCRDGSPCHSVEVDCVPFGELLDEFGAPHYLKIDIERADRLCIEALRGRELPDYVSIEAHDLSYLDLLGELGYTRFKLVDQTTHNGARPQVERVKRRLGIGQRFPLGSSGPFGEATRGDWSDRETIASHWRNPPNPRGWFDFHAGR